MRATFCFLGSVIHVSPWKQLFNKLFILKCRVKSIFFFYSANGYFSYLFSRYVRCFRKQKVNSFSINRYSLCGDHWTAVFCTTRIIRLSSPSERRIAYCIFNCTEKIKKRKEATKNKKNLLTSSTIKGDDGCSYSPFFCSIYYFLRASQLFSFGNPKHFGLGDDRPSENIKEMATATSDWFE